MSGTQYNQDPYKSRPEHRLHETNEPLQRACPTTSATGVCDQPVLNSGMPPTGRHRDATLGHTAGAGVPDKYNITQVRAAGTGLDGQQYNPTAVSDQPVPNIGIPPTGRHHDATLGHTAGPGVPDEYNTTQGRTVGTGIDGQQYNPSFTTNAPNKRVLYVTPIAQGGVAMSGQSDLPIGYADMGDKIIGKTQKVVGKMTNNPELQEKGERRKSGGKAVAQGLARAPPHD